ncbi:MAG: homocysteine S-methyltransferase family protein [Flavobacteriales bacterium]|nr:homocysteine S-methyltransferase family protein [Flavobacteriales bacterium]
MKKTIREELSKRILVLDGAMGTMIQRHNLTEEDYRGERFADHPSPLKGNNDLLAMTRPHIIADIHRAYYEAGADFAETNTFSATTIAQADYGMESIVRELNIAAAKLARTVADEFTAKEPNKPRFVAGSIGPTNMSASLSPDVNDPGLRRVNFLQLKQAYREQAEGLAEGGVDAFLVETIFDTLNAKAALMAIAELKDDQPKYRDIELMVSGTITDASGRTLSGQTTEAFLASIRHAHPLSIGLNCALGAKQLLPYLQIMHTHAGCAVSAHPNAGLPNEFGAYDQTPEEMAEQVKEYLEEGLVNIIGGCCGTSPDHIRALAQLAAKYQPQLKIEERA